MCVVCAIQGDTAQRPTRDGPDDGHQGYMQVASMKQASMGMPIQIIADNVGEQLSIFIVEESYFDDFHMLKKRPPKQLEVPGNAFNHGYVSKRVLLYTYEFYREKARL